MSDGEAIARVFLALRCENREGWFNVFVKYVAEKNKRACEILGMVMKEEIMPEDAPPLWNEYLDSIH
ncbi:MAG: hypothetical protein ABFS22_07430 [Pseudomonadota bacterium]